MSWQNAVTDERFLYDNSSQITKNCGFDSVASSGALSNCQARLPHSIRNFHFDLRSEFSPDVTTNIQPVLPGDFGESKP